MDGVIGRIPALLHGSKGRLNTIVYGLGDDYLMRETSRRMSSTAAACFSSISTAMDFAPLSAASAQVRARTNSVISM